ncbi:ricin-type beta-trefoil lectin domain protein [Streptomyces sp. NPDC008163]|uniref:ricin-type beta-trefoil lectin domain protein n=1 Tax=Streptomyces sp. NPDC008163 TaxID=3364818 RepID=UPI0036E94ED1
MSGENDPQHQAAAAESATTHGAAKPEAPETSVTEVPVPDAPKTAALPEPAQPLKPEQPAHPEQSAQAEKSEQAAPESTPDPAAPEAPDATATQAAAPDTGPTATAEAAAADPGASAADAESSTAPRPFGRPSRGLLAGAAIAGALLVGIPFLVSGALDRSGPGNGGPADTVADAGTLLNDPGSGAGSGAYASAVPEPSSPSPSPSGTKGRKDDGKGKPKAAGAVAGAPVARSTVEAPKTTKPSKAPKKKTPPKPTVTATVTAAPGTTLFGHASNRCIEMVAHKGADGSPLQIANCTGKNWQKWDFRPDGTIRSMGLCMDVAWGSHDNGAVIQIAWCSGNPAQQFVLSADHDLVNPQANKCVDVKDAQTGAGARLQLWDCNGRDNQKWSRR